MIFKTREEKSMLGFKASKDKLTFLLGANETWDHNFMTMFIWHFKNRRALGTYTKHNLSMLYKWNSKAWVIVRQYICLQHGLWNISSPLLRLTEQKKCSFKYITAH